MATRSSQSIRRYILTASVAVITATGAWYGAGLKSRQEFKQETKIALQASPAEKIDQLEGRRYRLLEHKAELQKKIDRLTPQPSDTAHDAQQTSR